MVYSYDDYNYVVRLNKGERWSEAFAAFAKETKLDGAWLAVIGGVLEVTLGFYDIEKKQYQWRTFEGVREITGLQGNLALSEDGGPVAHMHGTFAGENYQLIGGHVKDFVAGATVEAFIHKFNIPLRRKTDPAAGLPILDV